MQENDFRNWLSDNKHFEPRTVVSRMNNCSRIERFEGNLDEHFETDKCCGLLKKLTYSTDDEKHNRPQRHNIQIDGDIRTGTSTLKQAVNLYVEFKQTCMTAGLHMGRGTVKTATVKAGDIVRLKSGGPEMTVEEIASAGSDNTKIIAKCRWFSGGEVKSGQFGLEALALV